MGRFPKKKSYCCKPIFGLEKEVKVLKWVYSLDFLALMHQGSFTSDLKTCGLQRVLICCSFLTAEIPLPV